MTVGGKKEKSFSVDTISADRTALSLTVKTINKHRQRIHTIDIHKKIFSKQT